MSAVFANRRPEAAAKGLASVAIHFAFALASIAAPIEAQRTWVVDDTMAAGADFPDLVSAYAAAARGDRIHVRPGSGSGYLAPAPFTKAVSVIGVSASVRSVLRTATGTNGYIRCAVGDVMSFDNLEFQPNNSIGIAIWVDRSHGLVLLSRVTVRGYVHAYTPWITGIQVTNRLVLVDSSIVHGRLSIYAEGTRLWLLNCQTQTLSAGDRNLNGAIRVNQGSFLRVVGGRHIGGDGLADCYPLSPGYLGEAAIFAAQGPAVVSGPATLIGGQLWVPNLVCGAGGNSGRVSAIESNCGPGTNGTVIDPMVVRQSFGPGPGCRLNQMREMPAVIPRPAARGQPQTIDAWGPQQSIVAVFASFLTPYEPIVLPVGDVWLDPSLTVHIGSGGVDAQRHVAFTTTIPTWLAIGDALVYQAVSLSPASGFEISAPGIAVVH